MDKLTVQRLIEILQTCDPNKQVAIDDPDTRWTATIIHITEYSNMITFGAMYHEMDIELECDTFIRSLLTSTDYKP